jgi:hypothetical protein
MSGTRVALEVGSFAVDQALLIAAIAFLSALSVCLTVIILVMSVERSDRVKAIRALAPVLSRTRVSRNRRNGRGVQPHDRAGRRAASESNSVGAAGFPSRQNEAEGQDGSHATVPPESLPA